MAVIRDDAEFRSTRSDRVLDSGNSQPDATGESYDRLVHQLFDASLDLHAALSLVDNHRATEKILCAIDGLDKTINQVRLEIFGIAHPEGPRPIRPPHAQRHTESLKSTERRAQMP